MPLNEALRVDKAQFRVNWPPKFSDEGKLYPERGKKVVGCGHPNGNRFLRRVTGLIHISYDIDFVDPAFAPGTGTPGVGGQNSF